MVYMWQSMTFKDGKRAQAFEHAAKIAAYFKEKYPERPPMEVLRNINGPGSQLHFLIRFESLAEYEELAAEWFADPVVQELVAEGPELRVEGSLVNNFFATVP